MRPTRLEVQGFASFREPTVVDLDGADLFVLTGPTGSGKSSLIDAMVFALYGCVPRYDDRRLVAPVITQGRVEARVRLDFAVDGGQFTAVRIVRRTRTGATTKEARLERASGEVIASGPDELSTEVERLLGLRFDHFTKCVVLPQGDFAEFLHATWQDRRDLLVRLLDLGVYGSVREAANQRAARSRSQADLLATRLERDLAGATAEAREGAAERVAAIEAVRDRIEQAAPELDGLRERVRAARAEAQAAAGRAAALENLEVPGGVAELSERLADARRRRTGAEEKSEAAAASVQQAQAALGDLPDRGALTALLDAHDQRPRAARAVAELQRQVAAARRDEQATAAALARAEDATAAARDRLDELRRRHSAAALARHLTAGDPCPVCRRPVDEPPDLEPPAAMEEAEADLESCLQVMHTARVDAGQAAQRRAAAETELGGARKRLDEIDERLRDQPARGEVEDALQQVAAAAQRLEQARTAEQAARSELRQARQAVAGLEAQRKQAWSVFDAARDRVAALDPPTVDRDDLAGAWRDLVGWADERSPRERAAADEAAARAEEATRRGQAVDRTLRDACAQAGVDVGDRAVRDACTEALAEARAALKAVAQAVEEAERVRREQAEAERREALASALGRHLSARNFERWLLGRAIGRLVAGASVILRDLTQGAYSLALDEASTFQVVDHHSADEVRPARTLSGGETFLASLSLALALAEHVAEMAAHGGARLEALFLDEGFGTLDPETLETVATAIEELHARGRMVGLVTHVRELAERMPVRFEVSRGPAGSAVERVTR